MNKENNIYELNYSNTEYYDRHPGCGIGPKQTILEWHNWDELINFFTNYFKYFNDDITNLDNETFVKIVKTIWRLAYVAGVNQGREDIRSNTPSFMEQLQDYFKSIQRHNTAEMDETFHDIITPTDIWNEVLHMKIKK